MGKRTKAREKCGGNKRLVSIEFILYMLLFTVSKFPLARKTHSRKSSHLIPLWYSRSLLNNNNVRMKYAKCAHQTIICTAISRHNIGFLSPSPKCESLMKTDAVVLCWAQFHWLPYNTCSFFLPYSLTKLRRFFPDAVVVIAVVGGGWVLPFVFLFIVVIVCNIKYIHHIYTFSPADVRFTRLPRYLFYVCAIFPRFNFALSLIVNGEGVSTRTPRYLSVFLPIWFDDALFQCFVRLSLALSLSRRHYVYSPIFGSHSLLSICEVVFPLLICELGNILWMLVVGWDTMNNRQQEVKEDEMERDRSNFSRYVAPCLTADTHTCTVVSVDAAMKMTLTFFIMHIYQTVFVATKFIIIRHS